MSNPNPDNLSIQDLKLKSIGSSNLEKEIVNLDYYLETLEKRKQLILDKIARDKIYGKEEKPKDMTYPIKVATKLYNERYTKESRCGN